MAKTPNLAWEALYRTMNDLLFAAENVLIKWMNENDCNKPSAPEWHVCGYIDMLTRWNPDVAGCIFLQQARENYVRDCFTTAAFCFEHTGHEFNDDDVSQEIGIRWNSHFAELAHCHGFDNWPDYVEPLWIVGWATDEVKPRPAWKWKTRGVLMRHDF